MGHFTLFRVRKERSRQERRRRKSTLLIRKGAVSAAFFYISLLAGLLSEGLTYPPKGEGVVRQKLEG